MKISPARKAAFEVLFRIDKEKAFSSILLPRYEQKLDVRDSSLCHQLTLGVLRNKIYLDRVIELFSARKTGKFDLEVLTALRIGLYQILFLEKIPAYSAINESVNLVKAAKKRSASGLVNAVLRKAVKQEINLDFGDKVEQISVENSHPRWLIERWADQFGLVRAEALANANNSKASLTFRFTKRFFSKSESDQQKILKALASDDNIERSELVSNCYRASRMTREIDDLAQSNFIYFQDEASQLTADGITLERDQVFLDVCASPGSKATYVAAFSDQNALVVAGDLYPHRIRTLKSNAEKQKAVEIAIAMYDAEKALPFPDESIDVVLVDAPCSGTGTIRRNPEIRYSLSRSDFGELASKQLTILKNASNLVKSGGKLVYSTCSIDI
ncbi:MAG: 16S rRNA (cytosine(967)-C(5))-methyltransferase RsmB, partial [Pyrinomonadaceae bacterium]|nr:16S rRNA (cytosine(967)-C(5))-methyltransferase RsmB [Pyrinomonadaceae bacterium]